MIQSCKSSGFDFCRKESTKNSGIELLSKRLLLFACNNNLSHVTGSVKRLQEVETCLNFDFIYLSLLI